MEFIDKIHPDVLNLLQVMLFSLLIGLEQRRLHSERTDGVNFGTDRTFTFIGLLGFILYMLDPEQFRLFAGGGIVLGAWLGVYYHHRLGQKQLFGITSLVVGMITYCLGPAVVLLDNSIVLLIVIGVLLLTEMKPFFKGIISQVNDDEFITLGTFLAMALVILPMVPDKPLFGIHNLSLYRLFLAIVVISGMSYLSYLVRKFVFPKSGVELSGALAGFYSSTAATLVLSRQSKGHSEGSSSFAVGILLSTTSMMMRIAILAMLFNPPLGLSLLPYLGIMAVVAASASYLTHKKAQSGAVKNPEPTLSNNPLEFKVAILFGGFYVLFSFITFYCIKYFGTSGLNLVAVVVGFADIEPFLMNIYQGEFSAELSALTATCLIAITSNNILKSIYVASLANTKVRKKVVPGLIAVVITGIFCILIQLI